MNINNVHKAMIIDEASALLKNYINKKFLSSMLINLYCSIIGNNSLKQSGLKLFNTYIDSNSNDRLIFIGTNTKQYIFINLDYNMKLLIWNNKDICQLNNTEIKFYDNTLTSNKYIFFITYTLTSFVENDIIELINKLKEK